MTLSADGGMAVQMLVCTGHYEGPNSCLPVRDRQNFCAEHQKYSKAASRSILWSSEEPAAFNDLRVAIRKIPADDLGVL